MSIIAYYRVLTKTPPYFARFFSANISVANVTIASRQPIKFFPQRILGKDVHFWKKTVGIDDLSLGQWLTIKEPVTRLTTDGVMWTEAETEKIDTIILATGYRPNQGFLADLGALHSDGQPQQKGGVNQPLFCVICLLLSILT